MPAASPNKARYFAAGYRDSDPRQSVHAMFAAIASIITAVPIPVSADLEAGFGDRADYATSGQVVLRHRARARRLHRHPPRRQQYAAPRELCLCRRGAVGGGVGWGDGRVKFASQYHFILR